MDKIVWLLLRLLVFLPAVCLNSQVIPEPLPERPGTNQHIAPTPPKQPYAAERIWASVEPHIRDGWRTARPFVVTALRSIAWPVRKLGIEPSSGAGLFAAALFSWWLQVTVLRLLWQVPGRYGGWYDARLFHIFLRLSIWAPLWRRALRFVLWFVTWWRHITYSRPSRMWMSLPRKATYVYHPGDSVPVGTLSDGPLRFAQPVGLPGLERGVAIVAAPGAGKTVHMQAMIGSMPPEAAALITPDCDGAMVRTLGPGLMRDGHRVVKYDADNLVPEIPQGHWNVYDDLKWAIATFGPGVAYQFAFIWAQSAITPDSLNQPVFVDTTRVAAAGYLLGVHYFELPEDRNIMTFRKRITFGLPEAARPGEHPVDAWLRVLIEKASVMDDGCGGMIASAIISAASVMPKRGSSDGNNSFWSTLIYQTAWMDDPNIAAISKTSDIIAADLKGSNVCVFLVASLTDLNKGRLAPWVRIYISIVLWVFQKKDPEKKLKVPMTIYVDEAQNTGRIELLTMAVSGFRKYGIRVVTVWQSLQGAQRAYPNEWRDLWGLSQCMIWMGTADPATLKYLAEEILQRTTRRELVEGTPWWKLWGEQVKSRYVEKEGWLADSSQCGQMLDPRTEQVIVTGMGLPPMVLRRAKYYVDTPLWRHERHPGFKENILKSALRSAYGRYLHRIEERKAFREFVARRTAEDIKPAASIPALPPSPPVHPEIRQPAPPEPDFVETLAAQVVWQIEFDPGQGGFPDAVLRERVWNALSGELEQGGNVYLAIWTLDKRGFTAAERNKVYKHFMAAVAAENRMTAGPVQR